MQFLWETAGIQPALQRVCVHQALQLSSVPCTWQLHSLLTQYKLWGILLYESNCKEEDTPLPWRERERERKDLRISPVKWQILLKLAFFIYLREIVSKSIQAWEQQRRTNCCGSARRSSWNRLLQIVDGVLLLLRSLMMPVWQHSGGVRAVHHHHHQHRCSWCMWWQQILQRARNTRNPNLRMESAFFSSLNKSCEKEVVCLLRKHKTRLPSTREIFCVPL